jgi:hypothetical protein
MRILVSEGLCSLVAKRPQHGMEDAGSTPAGAFLVLGTQRCTRVFYFMYLYPFLN